MAHRSWLRPDLPSVPQSADEHISGAPSHPEWDEPQATQGLTELVNTLAACGGGSPELALDLVLHDIVGQACLATGATAAAIALWRGDEMVCRAATGTEAPDLGIRLETRAGLSGACVQARELQQCHDTELDPRVDRAACQRLGVRSLLVLPLLDGDELFGIFEIFSPRPNAFDERDVHTVLALAHRIVQNRRRLKDAANHPPTANSAASLATASPPVLEEQRPSAEPEANRASPVPQAGIRDEVELALPAMQGGRTAEMFTASLGVLVIAAALLLGTLVGWRLGWQKALLGKGGHSPQVAGVVSKATAPPAQEATEKNENATAVKPPVPAAPSASSLPKPSSSSAPITPAPPPMGGLVVYQNGKVVYSQPPSTPTETANLNESQGTAPVNTAPGALSPAGAPGAVQVPEAIAAARLIRRVEPQYPLEARQQRLQGAVVLQAAIARDGSVQNAVLLKGEPELGKAAVQAVKQWRYQPYVVDGKPVEMETTITLNFKLPSD
jgi:TonB family protein